MLEVLNLRQPQPGSPGSQSVNDDDGESTPLDDGEELRHFLPELEPSSKHDDLQKSSHRHVIVMCVLFLFLVEFSMYIMEPPLQALMEDFVCHNLYSDHAAATPGDYDSRCKNDEVQMTLAMARSWLMWVGMFVPLLVQIPYGIVADRYGRRPVMFCGIFGLVLSTTWNIVVLRRPDIFSIWHLLIGPSALLIGGGIPVIEAIAWTILTDSTSATDRTSLFYRIYAAMLIISAALRPVAAWLLSIDPWLPIWIGLAVLVLSLLSTLLVPETLQVRHQTAHQQSGPKQDETSSCLAILSAAMQELSRIWRFFLASKSLMLLVFANSLCNLVYIAFETTLLQYVSRRFNWDWSKATLLTTINKGTSVVLLLAVLPLISSLMNKRLGMNESLRDLYMCRGSVIFITIGSLLTAFAGIPWSLIASLVIFSFGNGFEPQLRALLTVVVDQDSMATLSTALATAETLVGLGGVPILGWLLGEGIGLGGMWMGLPFVLTTLCAASATAAMFVFRLPQGDITLRDGGYRLADQTDQPPVELEG